jgi:hypothetical protein
MPSNISRASAVGAMVATAMLGFVSSSRAESVQELQAQVDALNKRMAELERTSTAGSAKEGVAASGGSRGTLKLANTNTTLTVGGYVKFDAVYSDKSAGVGSTADQQYEAGAVPVGPAAGANERNQLKLHARQSRLFIKTSTPSALGDVGTYLEFDLFGAAGNESVSNSDGLRVRHAYGTLSHLLAGQTWTTFSDPAAYPETLDFGGPAGQIFARQAQVRWTDVFDGGQWSLALENPESVVSLPDGTSFRADDDRVPDLTGNIKFATARGTYTLAALARQIRVDSGSAPASRTHQVGYGIGLNGVVPIGARDDARFSLYQGNALGRYTVGFFSDGILDAAGTVALPRQWLAAVAYRHHWTPTLRSTLALSTIHARNGEGTAATVNRDAQSAHLNVIWSPLEQANLGLEYLVARRETNDGASGQLHRVQASAQYLF